MTIGYLFALTVAPFVIHFIAVVSYSARVSGGLLGRVASSVAIMNILLIVSRAASALSAPIIAKSIEMSLDEQMVISENMIRVYLISGLVGGVSALLLFERARSYFTLVLLDSTTNLIKKMFTSFFCKGVWQKEKNDKVISSKSINIKVYIANTIGTAIWIATPMSAMLAGILVPEFRTTAIYVAAFVNGVATILLFSYCDPYFARNIDNVGENKDQRNSVRLIMKYAAVSYVFAIILSQILLTPFAHLISKISEWL